MAKNIFTAVDPAGITHKRSTERSYAYTVVSKEGEAYLASKAPDLAKVRAETEANYDELIAQSKGIHKKSDLWRGEKALAFFEDFAKRYLIENPSREAYADEAVKHAQEQYDARVAGGRHLRYENAGWCSRLDLAQKLAGTLQGQGYEDIQILVAIKK